ncbi:MAG: hypothetical protein HFH58_01300 [Lachnospiraceae bacterium]|jgi:hypothetical protein|nr:hypothetical protein [Lachnospiraceae bacterium]
MDKEIGSEFWDVPAAENNCRLFPESTQWFLSGRSALQAVIKELNQVKRVAMPSWCCDSMVKPFMDAGIEVKFYPVCYTKDRGVVQTIDTECDVLFLMDYFGYTSAKTVSHPCIIRDVTHSIFSHSYDDADFQFGSLRKWCGVWTGGYAWTKDSHKLILKDTEDCNYITLRQIAMEKKRCYMNGVLDKIGQNVEDKSYLEVYAHAEALLETCGVSRATERDIYFAQILDVNFIKNSRRANAKVLMEAFPDWLLYPDLADSDCPMFVPIFVPNGKRDALRKYLIAYQIYCPIHWPVSSYHNLNKNTDLLYRNELSLVCDQRYTEEDMYRMVETIKRFWREG